MHQHMDTTDGYSMKDIIYNWSKGNDSVAIEPKLQLPQFRLLGYRQGSRIITLSTGRHCASERRAIQLVHCACACVCVCACVTVLVRVLNEITGDHHHHHHDDGMCMQKQSFKGAYMSLREIAMQCNQRKEMCDARQRSLVVFSQMPTPPSLIAADCCCRCCCSCRRQTVIRELGVVKLSPRVVSRRLQSCAAASGSVVERWRLCVCSPGGEVRCGRV